MNSFSIITSTISPVDIGLFVKEKYSFDSSPNCKLLKAGINHSYLIDFKEEKFIFRIYSYQWRTPEEISEEIRLLLLLQQKEISISYPIADNQDQYIQSITAPEGERYAVLFSYAEGLKIQNYNPKLHYKVGQLMAEIHQTTIGLTQKRSTYNATTLIDDSLDYIKEFLSPEDEEMKFLLDLAPFLKNRLNDSPSKNIRTGIVHLDIWFDNLNITAAENITVFDFDFCGNGWLCLDIAYYIMQVHYTEKDSNELALKIEHFIKGYESKQRITPEEKELLPLLGICLYYFYLGVQCKRFDNWSNTFLNKTYLKRYISVIIKGYYSFHKLDIVKK